MKNLDITDMSVRTGPNHKIFALKANGIPLECSCTLQEFNEEFDDTMKKVNENFRNSLRYIKYYKTLPKNPDPKKLNVWVSSDTGLAVRLKNDQIKEFTPFSFE